MIQLNGNTPGYCWQTPSLPTPIPPVDGNTILNIPVPGSEIELPFMGKNITFNGEWSFAAGTMTTPAGMSPGSVLTYDAPIVEFPPDNKNAV